jgi:hypothetical protein
MSSAKALRPAGRSADFVGCAMRAIGTVSSVAESVGIPAAKLACDSLQRLFEIAKVSALSGDS